MIRKRVLNDIKLGKSIKEAAKNNNVKYNTAKDWFRKKCKRQEKLCLLPAPQSKRDKAFFQRAKIGVLNDIKLGKSVKEAAINNLVAISTVKNWLSIKNRFGEQGLISPKVVCRNKRYSKQDKNKALMEINLGGKLWEVAKKYDINDNTLRKWIREQKKHEKELELVSKNDLNVKPKIYYQQNKNMVNEKLISINKSLENLLIKSSENQNIKPPKYQKNLNLKLFLKFSQEELNNQQLNNNIEISTQHLSCQVKIQLSNEKQPIITEQTINNQEFDSLNNFNFAPQDNFLHKDLSDISYDPNETFEDLDLSLW